MGWERMVVYTLDCDVPRCRGGGGRTPGTEEFLPAAGDGLHGAEKEARHTGWTVKREPGRKPLYACPTCTRSGRVAEL